jgi:competence protein ComEA
MDVLQGINMKKISPKALICALLTSMLLFTSNVMSAESKITTDVEVMQQSVYLNKSTIEDLVTLKGIGHKKAQAIVAYREKIGGFKSVSELIQVKGIGEKILSDNKDRLKI